MREQRSVGRHIQKWTDSIKKDVAEKGIVPERWVEATHDRKIWRGAVEQTYEWSTRQALVTDMYVGKLKR